jgi:hypothetical protein
LDDTSVEALDGLAWDRAQAAIAFARAGDAAGARALLDQADDFNRTRRAAGASDHGIRHQSALIALGRGLLASGPAEKRAAFTAGLAEIGAMPPEPQQLRYIRELRATFEEELAQLAGQS